jgi:hypothetical protein
MAETAKAPVGPSLQPGVVPVATTPLNMGPLRLESMDGPPSSGKMVSLADLHVNTNTPGTGPGQTETHVSISLYFACFMLKSHAAHSGSSYFFIFSQGVDPFDPLLQHLLRDNAFIAAVQASQIHVAAAAAVKVLRVGVYFFK